MQTVLRATERVLLPAGGTEALERANLLAHAGADVLAVDRGGNSLLHQVQCWLIEVNYHMHMSAFRCSMVPLGVLMHGGRFAC